MPEIEVRCTVDNCYFWAKDNFCNAESILITSDGAVDRYPESVDSHDTAMIVGEIGETPAQHGRETACKTFFKKTS